MRHRIWVVTGGAPSHEELQHRWRQFAEPIAVEHTATRISEEDTPKQGARSIELERLEERLRSVLEDGD